MDGEIALRLSEREAEYLKDIIDIWMEGCRDADTDIQNDRAIDNVDDFIILIQEIKVIHMDAYNIREKLRRALDGSSSSLQPSD